MTSRPLFISVAESIVILRPILHVGCFSASSAETADEFGRGPAAERSARRGQHQAADFAARAAVQALMNRVVLAVDRQDRDALARRGLGDDAAGHHQDFLVGERDRLAVLDRREDRFERLGAARGAQHEVHVRMRRDGDEAVAAGAGNRHVRPGARSAAAGRSRRRSPSRRRAAGTARSARRDARRSRPPPGRRPAADRDARRRRRARSGRSSRWIRGWRCASQHNRNRRARRCAQRTPFGLADRPARLRGSDVSEDNVVHRRREEQRVDPIQDAAVARNQRRAVLHAGAALQHRLEEIAGDAERDQRQAEQRRGTRAAAPAATTCRRRRTAPCRRRAPPIAPSIVFFGLTTGASGGGRRRGRV